MSGTQKRDRQAGERVGSNSYQREIQTTHIVVIYRRVGEGGDSAEIRLDNANQIVYC